MRATQDELEALFAIQEIDLEAARLSRELSELPQRGAILEARKKREGVLDKLDSVKALKKDASKKLTKIDDEDASLQKKENGVQAAIEAAGNDFRGVEARTKELDGIFRRRGVLAEERKEAAAKLAEIESLEKRIASALSDLDSIEQREIASFKEQGGALQMSIAKANSRRDGLLSELGDDIADLYERTSQLFDTVFIGHLDGAQCSVCRTKIETGRLIDLKGEAPLAICPSCKRLLVVNPS